MSLAIRKEKKYDIIDSLLTEVSEACTIEGYDVGYNHGYDDVYSDRMKEDLPAISDGLRKGSSNCGRSLVNLKTMKGRR